ncbi:MAG TPA: hypothetical protein VEI97_05370 [bacterium]|nr:hypothetical protein [bacterium]
MTAPSLRLAALACAGLLALSGLACSDNAEADEHNPDPNKLLWRQMAVTLSEEAVSHIAILRVEDKVSHQPDVERQVQQALLDQLTQISDLDVLEADRAKADALLQKHKVDPATGIPSAVAADLCTALGVQAIVYATVENGDYDVNLKVYVLNPGNVIFSKTLQDLTIPKNSSAKAMTKKAKPAAATHESTAGHPATAH